MASINNLTAVYADRFYLSSSTGVSEISDTYATKTELGDINTANSSNITANADAISVLNTKQLQNFYDISSISHILATTYQTNLQISSSYYSKVEIDTTFSNVIHQHRLTQIYLLTSKPTHNWQPIIMIRAR